MRHKKIILTTTDGFRLAASHTISKSKAVVLWLHGITVNKDEYLNLFKLGAEFLADNGIDSIRIDFRGHGESSGESTDFSIIGQLIDVDAAINYIKTFYKQKNLPIHIVGCSFGAPPSLFAAVEYGSLIKSVVLIAPVLSYIRTFIKPETEWAQELFNIKTIKSLEEKNKLYINENFAISINLFKEMRVIHPENSLSDIKQKLVVIHGVSDSMVPYAVSKNLASIHTNISFVSMKDMDHGFNDKDDEIGNSNKSRRNRQKIYDLILKTACK